VTALLIALAIGFAWSIGAHYTGAVMGMPHALRAIGAWQALVLMAPLAFLGATFASHAVEKRVGSGLTDGRLGVSQQVVVIGVAFAVTTFFNRFRMPTSTIQILVFSVVGVTLGAGVGVRWRSIEHLIGVWAAAPAAAIVLGLLLTLVLDRLPLGGTIGAVLVAVGACAAFAMGANDVSNASGALVGTGTFSPLALAAPGTWAAPVVPLPWVFALAVPAIARAPVGAALTRVRRHCTPVRRLFTPLTVPLGSRAAPVASTGRCPAPRATPAR
jgi:PiT family inorganic phosphate transporter